MNADAYQLRSNGALLRHWPQRSTLLRDGADDTNHLEIEALVASGDCLITLATALDDTTQHLTDDSETIRPQLENIIRTLLYLQRHYRLTRKPAEHRQ